MRKTEFLAAACDPKTLTVGQLMQDAVFTCSSRTDALTVSRLMTQRNFGSLPVVEEDRTLVGLISEYDLLQAMIEGRDLRKVMVDMEVPGYQPLEYEVHLGPKGTGHSISREVLSQMQEGHTGPFKHIDSSDRDVRYYEIDKNKLVRPNWEHNPMETSLSQVPKMFRQPEELRRILATATQYHVLDVGPRAPVKLPQQMKPALLPGSDGGDLVPYLYYLRESDKDRFAAVVDTLKVAFRDFEALSFPPVAAGMLAMTWKDKNFEKPLYMNELSEGTLRFLWLVSLLQSPSLSTITMIDEPEVSLHPELLSLLADLMREAAKRTQLIVATHSERFIRFLQPEEVVVMDIDEDGNAVANWSESLDLESWLAEYSLDEVWRMGRMGGRS